MTIALILQIFVSLALIVLVTLQSKDASLGSGFASATNRGFHTKRGPEKMIYLITVFLSVVFVVLSFLNIAIWK